MEKARGFGGPARRSGSSLAGAARPYSASRSGFGDGGGPARVQQLAVAARSGGRPRRRRVARTSRGCRGETAPDRRLPRPEGGRGGAAGADRLDRLVHLGG